MPLPRLIMYCAKNSTEKSLSPVPGALLIHRPISNGIGKIRQRPLWIDGKAFLPTIPCPTRCSMQARIMDGIYCKHSRNAAFPPYLLTESSDSYPLRRTVRLRVQWNRNTIFIEQSAFALFKSISYSTLLPENNHVAKKASTTHNILKHSLINQPRIVSIFI